jgi:hypothetical protein
MNDFAKVTSAGVNASYEDCTRVQNQGDHQRCIIVLVLIQAGSSELLNQELLWA